MNKNNANQKLKVLWLIKGLGGGGAERLLESSLPYVNRERFEYHVAYFLPWKECAVFPASKKSNTRAVALNIGRLYHPLSFWRLLRLLRRERFDIIHIHSLLWRYSGRIVELGLQGLPATLYTENNIVERYIMLSHGWEMF
jgi:glycosyltransferase involved in cell wall biosynthesis